ncbi:MAG: YabP/YqfC family sporulation protein [Clostridia bacterium]|nr:YabP/YqfC family sporulation protein [Clostridia bacterium]
MGFMESINCFLGVCNINPPPYRITALGNYGAHIEGVVKVCDLNQDKIALFVKGGKIVFYGKGLTLSSYLEKDVTISGKVEKIEWQN